MAAALLYHDYSKERFENRRHWACFRHATTIDIFFTVLYSALCINADTSRSDILPTPTQMSLKPEDQLSTIIRALQTPNLPRLLILDGLDGMESHRSVVEPILQQLVAIPNMTVIVTMQGTTTLPQAVYGKKLDPLSPRDAKLLFLEVYPHSDPMLDDLVKQLDFHPLTIVVVAHICQSHGTRPSALFRRWRDHGLFSLPTESEELGVAPLVSSIKSSTNRLPSPDATKLFQIICSLPAGVMLQDLSSVAPTIQNIGETARLLGNLSLASMDEGAHLTVLAPIRSQFVKYNQLDQQSKRDLFFYHFELAREGLRNIGDAGYVVGIKKLLKRQENVEAILSSALEDGDIPAIEATLHYSSPRCTMRPRLHLVKKAVEAAKRNEFSLPQEQALLDGSVALTAQCIRRYGEMNIEAGNFGLWFDEAIERFEKLGDQASIAHCKFFKAHGIWINDQKQGIKDLEQVRDTFANLGNVAGESQCQLKLADYYIAQGRYDDARESCQRSLSQLKEPYHKALCHRILAQIYQGEERLEDARYLLTTAIETLKKFGDRFTSAECQKSLSSVYRHLGRIEDARGALRQAIAEYDVLGRSLDGAFARWHLCYIVESDEAIKVLEEAIPAFWHSEFTFAGAECRLHLGILCMTVGRFDDALLHFQIARPQLLANNTPHHAANCLSYIVLGHLLIGDRENASLVLEAGRYELHTYFQQRCLPVPEPKDLTLGELVKLLHTPSMPLSIQTESSK